MDRRNYVRIGTVILFLILSIYFVWHPIFEKPDISQHEGETIPIYFTKIVGKSVDGYTVEVGIEKQYFEVITDAKFEKGDVVSFYGSVKNNRLIVQKFHYHEYPDMSYYLSFIGLIGFIYLMIREEG